MNTWFVFSFYFSAVLAASISKGDLFDDGIVRTFIPFLGVRALDDFSVEDEPREAMSEVSYTAPVSVKKTKRWSFFFSGSNLEKLLKHFDPFAIKSPCDESIGLMADKYAAPAAQSEFQAAHALNMAALKKSHSHQIISLSWIYHLAHLNDFSEIYEAKKEGEVKACLKFLSDQYELQSMGLPKQRMITEEIYQKLATGAYKQEELKGLRARLILNHQALMGHAGSHRKLMETINSIKFVRERMAIWECRSLNK